MTKNKILFAAVLAECDCPPAVFFENCGTDAADVKKKIDSAQRLADIQKIVKNYI